MPYHDLSSVYGAPRRQKRARKAPGGRRRRRDPRKLIVGVVACSSKKNDPAVVGKRRLQARDLYGASDLFRKASSYADAVTDEWVILSAKYGLVTPDRLLPYYNQALPRSGNKAWAAKVRRSLEDRYDLDRTRFLVLAPSHYRKYLFTGSDLDYEAPMKGLGIGQQLGWLKTRLEALHG